MIENIYFNNQDFPGNNNVIWRPQAEGGKWRWITKDTDFGLGLYGSSPDYNTIKWLYSNNYDPNRNWANKPEHTILFRHLMADTDFKTEFLNRAAIYMGDFLNENGTREVWDAMYDIIKTEYPYHRELINRWWPNYNDELNTARNWLNQRTYYVYKQLADYYNWGTLRTLTINKQTKGDITITVNGVKLTGKVFDGKYYQNRTLTIVGQATGGDEVTGWKVTGAMSEEVQGNELTLQMPKGSIAIEPLFGDISGIEDVQHSTFNSKLSTIYDLMGNKVKTPQADRIYIQNGKKIIINK